MTEWIAQGRYPIAIGLDDEILRQFQEKGLGRNVELLERVSTGYLLANGLSVFKDAPHPNVAKLVMRWMLTQEGQDARASTVLTSSRRLDVKSYEPEFAPDYSRLGEYTFRVGTRDGEEILSRTLELTKQPQ